VHGEQVTLVKPQTYMNRSGAALGPLLKNETFDPARDLLIVVDEVALPLGMLRIRRSGSAGGHNGLKSIAGRLQSEQFPRLRIGVGPQPENDRSDFVLGEFRPEEWQLLHKTIPTTVAAVECWLTEGIETAMNRFNRRGTESD
jgi:peptidyl-tRNA hydrolase, PTH1 family